MTDVSPAFRIICNGAKPKTRLGKSQKQIVLEWREGQPNTKNVKLSLSSFSVMAQSLVD